MKTEQLLAELKDVARRLGLAVREEKGNFRGGRCTVDGQETLMLNKRHLPERRLAVLAECLRAEPLDTIYLKPAVRRALSDLWSEAPLEEDDAPAHADG